MVLKRPWRRLQRSSWLSGTSPRGKMETEHGSDLGRTVKNREPFVVMETRKQEAEAGLVYKETTNKLKIRVENAQQGNIYASRSINEVVRTCLGQRAVFKVLMDPMGSVKIKLFKKEFRMTTYDMG